MVIIFSQFGEVVDCRLIRDKESGKSKGFAFICYEDQRSTVLAVDNLNGSDICGRVIRVDHVDRYKIPREYFETELDEENKIYKPSGPDGKGWGEDRKLTNEELEYFQELRQEEEYKMQRLIKVNQNSKEKYKIDSDEKWEEEFIKIVSDAKQKEINHKVKKDKKRKKKESKKKHLDKDKHYDKKKSKKSEKSEVS